MQNQTPFPVERGKIEFVQFSILSESDMKKFSVCEITKPSTGSSNKKYETPADPRLGPLANGILCDTCGFDNMICPGHFGHINLPTPVSNNACSQIILRILQSVCSDCGRSRILPEHATLKIGKAIKGFNRLKSLSERGKKIHLCPWDDCNKPLYNFSKPKGKNFERHCGDTKVGSSKPMVFTSGEILNVFLKIDSQTCEFLGFNSCLSENEAFLDNSGNHVHFNHPKDMIFTTLLVMPPVSRPYIVRDGQECDDDLTEKYNSILKIRLKLLQKREEGQKKGKQQKQLTEHDREGLESDLRNHVWTLIMNEGGAESSNSANKRPHKSITDRLKGKEGQFQTNIAGKRVDFSARTVIVGGGIFLHCDEVGIPASCASILTYPEDVLPWNKDYLQNLVSNGRVNKVKRVLPGGKIVVIRLNEYPDHGCKFLLKDGDKITRQLKDGDIAVINRQPSLRVEAKKAVIIRIIDEDAMRMPEWMTKSFNADYDGNII